jgi:hypothetical protein
MQGSTVMRQSGAETLVTEEPYALIAHVRVWGGCALQAHTVQPSAMAALIKRSQQSGTESCVRYGNAPNEA